MPIHVHLRGKSAWKGWRSEAFTLVEMLVSITVLLILLVVTSQLFNLTSKVSVSSNKRMDTDTQARTIFDRMAVDFGRMVIRKDVDYYVKQPNNLQKGNDQMAFFSQVPGYYSPASTTTAQEPLSLVAYRINAGTNTPNPSYDTMERLGKGLVWTATGNTTINSTTQTDVPLVFYPTTIATIWPQAVSATTSGDADYEMIGPGVFRFEYYYTLKQSTSSKLVPLHPTPTGTSTIATTFLSNTPWDPTLTNHTALNGWQDVACVTVVIAVVDSKTLPLISATQMGKLTGTSGNSILSDFDPTSTGTFTPGQLESQWRAAITQNVTPSVVAAAIRVYSRTFYLTTPTP